MSTSSLALLTEMSLVPAIKTRTWSCGRNRKMAGELTSKEVSLQQRRKYFDRDPLHREMSISR
jgi:hypothetical protein